MSLESMIAECESHLGLVGRPNVATRWYAERNGSWFANAAWCNMFITYCAYQSDNYFAVNHSVDYAYTVYHAQKFQSEGEWHTDVAGIRRGDIVFFDWSGSNSVAAIDHIGIVTKVVGQDIHTVEGNTSDSVARRVRRADTIVGYGRPAYAPEPKEDDVPIKLRRGKINGVTVVGVYADGLPTPNNTIPSAIPLQRQLKRVGYMPDSVVEADNYGPQTQKAVSKFHADHPKYAQGGDSDVSIGPSGWNHLKKHKADSAHNDPKPDTPAPDTGEPDHLYARVTYGGRTVNKRTREMLERAEVKLNRNGQDLPLAQGSYSSSVGASAGTHSGGGAVDILSGDWNIAKALREVGFAAWVRTPSEGPWGYHIHAVAIGDREMSSAARNQVAAYFAGRNALANNRADSAPSWVGRPYPSWAAKYK